MTTSTALAERLSKAHRFGGRWTADKLQVLREYVNFYTKALSGQPFKLVYIDTFAGTGRCHVKTGDRGEQIIDGSAKIALDCSPAFQAIHFVERKKSHAVELAKLIASHPNGRRATLVQDAAQSCLPGILASHNWKSTRGVLFLDPYGLQCDWPMIEQIAATQALDVFFLVSLSGLFRQAAIDERAVDEGKAAKLTSFLGTEGWRAALYSNEHFDLFDGPVFTRDFGYRAILNFTTERLRSVFAEVNEPRLLYQSTGAPLFALYFAISNPSGPARALASRVSNEILSKLR
jgi:three-Cys-motif partner protein